MNQDETNRAEWEDENNWSGPDWAAAYFSKKDSRVWVPKKIPWMGWTINIGRDSGVYWLIGFVVGIPIVLLAAVGIISAFVE